MNGLLVWLVPTAAGALIGWFTNYLAIKMLFRPFKALHVFGIRVPFTPGILPREKTRLALSIGDSVAKDLLTSEVLRARLEAPDVRDAVTLAARGMVDKALESDSRALLDAASRLGTNPRSALLAQGLAALWRGLEASGAFARGIEAALTQALVLLEDRRLDELLRPEELARLAVAFASEERDKRLAALAFDFAQTRTKSWLTEGKPLSVLLPAESALAAFDGALDAALPALSRALSEYLDDAEVRRILERYGSALVRKALDRLGTVQRLLVNAGGYERSIVESMPRTVDDLVDAIKAFALGAEGSIRLKAFLHARLEAAWQRPLGELLGAEADALPRLAGKAAETLVHLAAERLRDPELAESLARFMSRNAGASLGALLDLFGPDARSGLSGLMAGALGAAISTAGGGSGSGVFQAFVGGAAIAVEGQSLGGLSGLDEDWKERAAAALGGLAIEVAARETPRALASLDVSRLVSERIESLDMAELERMVLRVVDRELFWITALGGVLGAIIGLMQAAIAWFGLF